MTWRGAVREAVGVALSRVVRGGTSGRILLYHRVDRSGHPVLSVTPELFRAQLGWLGDAGLRATSLRELRESGFAAGLVALSFDDGDTSAAGAWEEVAARGGGATLFVVPEWIDRPGYLGRAELRALALAGAEIGAHGLAHEPLIHRDATEIARTLSTARERLEDALGQPVPGLAYPYGIAPRRARDAARLAGFAYACTSLPGRNDPGTDPYRLRRAEALASDARPWRLIGKLRGADDWLHRPRSLGSRWRYGA